MARVALEQALPSEWIDEVFEEHRQRQYSRELLFLTVIELVTLVSLGLRPSLHAAARSLETLPVALEHRVEPLAREGVLQRDPRHHARRRMPLKTLKDRGPDGPAPIQVCNRRPKDGPALTP